MGRSFVMSRFSGISLATFWGAVHARERFSLRGNHLPIWFNWKPGTCFEKSERILSRSPLFAYDYDNDDEYDCGRAVVGGEAFCRPVNLVPPAQSLINLRHLYEAKRGAKLQIFPCFAQST